MERNIFKTGMRLQRRNTAPLILSSISTTPHSEFAEAVVAMRAREPRRLGPALRSTTHQASGSPAAAADDDAARSCVAGDTVKMTHTVTVTRRLGQANCCVIFFFKGPLISCCLVTHI